MDSLVTPEQFASYMQSDLDRSTAELALAGASGVVRSWCRWDISREPAASMTVGGNNSTVVGLPTLKLNAAVVFVDGVELDVTTYDWSPNGQLHRLDGWVWPWGLRNIRADVDHGYDPIPDEVHIVVCALASRYYINPDGLRSKTVGAVSRTFMVESMRGDIAEVETALIAGYRLP